MYETMACAFRMDAYAALAIVLAFRLILSMIDFLMVVLFGWNLKPKKSSGRLLNIKTYQLSLTVCFVAFTSASMNSRALCSRRLLESNKTMSSTYLTLCAAPVFSATLWSMS